MESIKEFKVGNETLKIYYDSNSDSPREWDNMTQMIFTGTKQHLGDKHNVSFDGGYDSREDFIDRGEEMVRKAIKDVVHCKAVHLYSHSGQSISTSYGYPYNCRWDSGTIGFVIITKEAIRKSYSIKNVTKKYIDKCEAMLDAEVETLNKTSANLASYIVSPLPPPLFAITGTSSPFAFSTQVFLSFE